MITGNPGAQVISNDDDWLVMCTGSRDAPTPNMNTLSKVVAVDDEIVAWLEGREKRRKDRSGRG